tara:strand:- start:151 stop:1080 length:930 start_codon:yes stop_codon:yes gene_type:complete
MHKIYGTYSAALTPINDDCSINKELFLQHCNNLLKQGVDGLAIFGTTGEANSFSMDEKIEAINYLIDNKITPEKLIPGTGQCSIKDTVKLSKIAAKLNVKGVLVLPPFYYKNVQEEGVVEYFKKVVEEAGENSLRYILYNIPQVSGVAISINIIEKLIHLFPDNFVGMKDSSGDLDNMLRIIKSIENFSLFSGSDILALKVCKQGGAGAITATSNISGKLLAYILNNYKEEANIENFEALQDLQVKIRDTLFASEPISTLKAFLSIKNNEESWNRVVPPLITINNPNDHKTVIGLLELTKKMDDLLSHT